MFIITALQAISNCAENSQFEEIHNVNETRCVNYCLSLFADAEWRCIPRLAEQPAWFAGVTTTVGVTQLQEYQTLLKTNCPLIGRYNQSMCTSWTIPTVIQNYLDFFNKYEPVQTPVVTYVVIKLVLGTGFYIPSVLCPDLISWTITNKMCVYTAANQYVDLAGVARCIWGALQTSIPADPLVCKKCVYLNDTTTNTVTGLANPQTCLDTCADGFYVSQYGQALFCMRRCHPAMTGVNVYSVITIYAYVTKADVKTCMKIQDKWGNNIEPVCANTEFAEPISVYNDTIMRNDLATPAVAYRKPVQYQTVFQCVNRCSSDKADVMHFCFPTVEVRPGVVCKDEFWLGSRVFLCNALVSEVYPLNKHVLVGSVFLNENTTSVRTVNSCTGVWQAYERTITIDAAVPTPNTVSSTFYRCENNCTKLTNGKRNMNRFGICVEENDKYLANDYLLYDELTNTVKCRNPNLIVNAAGECDIPCAFKPDTPFVENGVCVYSCTSGILMNETHCQPNHHDMKNVATYPVPCVGYVEFSKPAIFPTMTMPKYLVDNSDKTQFICTRRIESSGIVFGCLFATFFSTFVILLVALLHRCPK